MPSHYDELARLRDAVVEAAKAVVAADRAWDAHFDADTGDDIAGWDSRCGKLNDDVVASCKAHVAAVEALLSAEAATCGKCGGRGFCAQPPKHDGSTGYFYDCPDCGGTGMKRRGGTFRDDSATTPEGDER